MIEAFVITLREGLEAAIAIGVILVYLKRMGSTTLNKFVYSGLFLGIIASFITAAVYGALNIDPENELVEGTMMLVSATLVGSVIIWMLRTAKNARKQILDKVGSLSAGTGTWVQRAGMLGFAFILVFREGVEVVLFLGALSTTFITNPVLDLYGGLLGILVAAAFGVLINKGVVKINLKAFFRGTAAILLMLVVTLVAGALHEFMEIKLLPSSPVVLQVIGFLVRDDTSLILLIALLAFPVGMVLWDAVSKARAESRTIPPTATKAEQRKQLAGIRRARNLRLTVGTATLALIILLGSVYIGTVVAGYDPAVEVPAAASGEVRISTTMLGDGKLHKYMFDVQGVQVRFLLIQRGDGTVGGALDACYICPPVGYYQKGETIICKNCHAPINIDTIGIAGGCNPRLLDFQVVGGEVVILESTLQAAVEYFRV